MAVGSDYFKKKRKELSSKTSENGHGKYEVIYCL